MTDGVSRRDLIGWVGVALLAAGGGCSSESGVADTPPNTVSSSPTRSTTSARPTARESATRSSTAESATRTSTEDPPGLAALQFSARVARQPSSDGPGKIVARLENPTNGTATVGYGHSLLYSLETSPSSFRHPEGIALVDEGERSDVTNRDGCWEFQSPETQTAWAYRPRREIQPGAAIEDGYVVVGVAETSNCLPSGEYRFENVIVGDGEEATIALTVTVTDDRRLSVATAGPIETPR